MCSRAKHCFCPYENSISRLVQQQRGHWWPSMTSFLDEVTASATWYVAVAYFPSWYGFEDSLFSDTVRCGGMFSRDGFKARSLVAESCVMSIWPHVSVQLPLDCFQYNLLWEACMKIFQETADSVKIGQKYQVLYVKDCIRFNNLTL